MLAHNLANKLSAVVSHCDLLDLEIGSDSDCSKHRDKIRLLAVQMADMLRTCECERKPSFSVDVEDRELELLVQ